MTHSKRFSMGLNPFIIKLNIYNPMQSARRFFKGPSDSELQLEKSCKQRQAGKYVRRYQQSLIVLANFHYFCANCMSFSEKKSDPAHISSTFLCQTKKWRRRWNVFSASDDTHKHELNWCIPVLFCSPHKISEWKA